MVGNGTNTRWYSASWWPLRSRLWSMEGQWDDLFCLKHPFRKILPADNSSVLHHGSWIIFIILLSYYKYNGIVLRAEVYLWHDKLLKSRRWLTDLSELLVFVGDFEDHVNTLHSDRLIRAVTWLEKSRIHSMKLVICLLKLIYSTLINRILIIVKILPIQFFSISVRQNTKISVNCKIENGKKEMFCIIAFDCNIKYQQKILTSLNNEYNQHTKHGNNKSLWMWIEQVPLNTL